MISLLLTYEIEIKDIEILNACSQVAMDPYMFNVYDIETFCDYLKTNFTHQIKEVSNRELHILNSRSEPILTITM